MYINGVLDNTSPTNIQGTILPGETATPGVFNPTVLGKGSQRISLDGLLDEARISSTARSADWIKTEYLNQSSPSTFYTLGVEESSADPTLSSLTTSLSTGNYSTGQVLPLTANFDKPVSGNLTFTFTLDGNQTRTCSTTITNATNVTCNYTVQSNDQTSKLTPTLTGSIQDIYGNQLNTFTPTTNEFNSKTISLNLNGGGGGSVPTFPVLTPNFSETNGQLTITNLPSDITQFVISDNPDLTNASWQPISGLSTSLNTFPNATPLYFKFQTRDGAQSTVYTYNRDLNHPLPPHCTYSDGTLIKTDSSIKVYVVKDCKKKWIPTPEVLEQLNYQWTDIKTLSSTQLNALSDYEDNLIRAFNDYKVYLVVNGTKRHIPNPNIFLNYGFKWEDVKDVNPTVIDSYRDAYLLRASKTNPIYFFTRGIRKYIPTMDIFNSYQDKTEDIQVISQYEMDHYPNSTLVKLENTNDIYLITDNYTTRRRIPNPTIFNKHRFNWNHVISVNPFEFYYYRWGSEVR